MSVAQTPGRIGVVGLAAALGVGALGFGLLGVGCGTVPDATPPEPVALPHPSHLQRGAELYGRNCETCHGYRGDGHGSAAPYLEPPPRDFTKGMFNLVRTTNGMPTDDDLVGVLRRGMPGSAMPSWAWMPTDDLAQLAAYVRYLAVEGLGIRIQSAGMVRRSPVTMAEARRRARRALAPGAVLATGKAVAPTADALALGKNLYLEHCAACHGRDGRGRRPVRRWRHQTAFAWTRDFRAGILRGGSSHQDLSWRIQAGMPASGMPPISLEDPTGLGALVAYVGSLIPQGVGKRLVQTRRRIQVQRVVDALPTDTDDPRWQPVRVVLAPLWWRDVAVVEAEIAMLHDGRHIAAMIRWRDGTRDDRAGRTTPGLGFSDAAALQFSADSKPPPIAMGSVGQPVHIWHWQPFHSRDLAGVMDLVDNPPHAFPDPLTGKLVRTDAPIYRPAAGTQEAGTKATVVRAAGVLSASDFAKAGIRTEVRPRWRNGVWEVMFRRPLQPSSAREMQFRPGSRAYVACAIWNGSTQSRHGEKSISMWHVLEIDP
ncbi:MAG: ethylbenzene dehydrogenase-related protein [Planctomycetota bacterium]|jgi:mono/diheme cytochrome c family protein